MSRISRSRNGETTPRHAETTISPQTTISLSLYSRKSRPIRRRFALRTAGSAGRSTFSGGVNELRRSGHAETVQPGCRAQACAARPDRGLLAGGALELLLQQRVGLLAVGAPRDPALRVDHVEGREVADAVGLRHRPARAVVGERDRGVAGSGSSSAGNGSPK